MQALVLAATDPGNGMGAAAAAASSNGSGAGAPARRVSLTQQDFARVRCAARMQLGQEARDMDVLSRVFYRPPQGPFVVTCTGPTGPLY